jgi:hypothetical protein
MPCVDNGRIMIIVNSASAQGWNIISLPLRKDTYKEKRGDFRRYSEALRVSGVA